MTLSRRTLLLTLLLPFGGELAALHPDHYELPHQLITPAEVESVRSAVEQGDCPTAQVEALALLERYHGQFLTGRRIESERRLDNRPTLRPQQLLRQLAELQSQPLQRPIVSPYLATLYRSLGLCAEELGDDRHARSYYQKALEHGDLLAPSALALPFAEEEPFTPLDAELEEALFFHLRNGFALPGRIAEEETLELAAAADRFAVALDRYQQLRPDLRRVEQIETVAAARIARRNSGLPVAEGAIDFATIAEARNRLGGEVVALREELQAILYGPYHAYLARERSRQAKLAWRLAHTHRRLDQSAERRRGSERSTRQDGAIITTRQPPPQSYLSYLELAHRFEPDNPLYRRELAEAHAARGERQRAIDLLQRINLPMVEEGEIESIQRLLGRLHSDNRNYLLAAEAYEAALERNPAGVGAAELRAHLAELHFRRTGRFERAAELYRQMLVEDLLAPAEPLAETIHERLNRIEKRFESERNLAAIARSERRSQLELAHLAASLDDYASIEAESERLNAARRAVEAQLLDLRRALLDLTDPVAEREYRRLQREELPRIDADRQLIEARLRRLPHIEQRERQALLHWRLRQFERSAQLWQEIIERADGAARMRARHNLTAIRQSQEDGHIRALQLSPQAER